MANIVDLIGKTPLADIRHTVSKTGVQVYGKLEGNNPGGSVKDRAAYFMIKGALERGVLRRGVKLVEATSGNTGIAMAMIAKSLGVDIVLIMPDNSTAERVQTMEAFGAEVILTPAEKTIEYSRELAEDMVSKGGFYMLNQFANPDNWYAHYCTTGPEIWLDTMGKVTHFVSSMGTTGTIMGVSTFLKEKNPNIQIIGVQPLEGSNIPGIRRWSPAFLPKIYQPERVDSVVDVSATEAIATMRQLALQDAIFGGVSSGGCIAAIGKILPDLPEGSVVVGIICDRGDRYLSSGVFAR